MVIQTDGKPFVVCKVLKEDAIDIQAGAPARIYIPSLDTTFNAKVTSLGNLSINTESQLSTEVSLNEVTVKLDFSDDIPPLHLNERVKVWFYQPLW